MLGDLASKDFQSKSVKQKKKIASSVASEMIARNQAYSNLLELLLPNFVRLSIHAHSNKGPKFGIRLLPKNQVRAIDNIDNRHEPVPAYEFQLPTPWHNSILKIEGDQTLYLAKAEVARAAISGGDYEGGWIEAPEGGHFSLKIRQTGTVATCDGTIRVRSKAGDEQVWGKDDANSQLELGYPAYRQFWDALLRWVKVMLGVGARDEV